MFAYDETTIRNGTTQNEKFFFLSTNRKIYVPKDLCFVASCVRTSTSALFYTQRNRTCGDRRIHSNNVNNKKTVDKRQHEKKEMHIQTHLRKFRRRQAKPKMRKQSCKAKFHIVLFFFSISSASSLSFLKANMHTIFS